MIEYLKSLNVSYLIVLFLLYTRVMIGNGYIKSDLFVLGLIIAVSGYVYILKIIYDRIREEKHG